MSKLNQVQKWGNSLAIRVPKAIAQQLGLEQNTPIRQTIVDGKLVIEAVTGPSYTLEELLADITPEMLHGEIPTGPAVGKEVF